MSNAAYAATYYHVRENGERWMGTDQTGSPLTLPPSGRSASATHA